MNCAGNAVLHFQVNLRQVIARVVATRIGDIPNGCSLHHIPDNEPLNSFVLWCHARTV